MTSSLKFTYESTELNSEEAAALLSLANNKDDLVIDLSTVIKVNAKCATEMFSLAVKHKNPALASIAARLVINQEENVDRRPNKRSQKEIISIQKKHREKFTESKKSALKALLETRIDGPVENIINELLQRDSRWSAGVVSILTFAPGKTVNQGPKETVTLKELSVIQNIALRRENLSPNSLAFQGFSFHGAYDVVPKDSPNVNRSESFFTSPTYNALREGLIFCKTNDLVELSHGLSRGSLNAARGGEDSGAAARLQRKFWQIKLSPKGEELIKQWGDSLDFLVNFWASRLHY